MIKEQGQSVQNVSETMSIGQTVIRRWLTQYSAEPSGQPGIGKPLIAEQRRIRQLEQENQQLRQDVTILKKASACRAEAKGACFGGTSMNSSLAKPLATLIRDLRGAAQLIRFFFRIISTLQRCI